MSNNTNSNTVINISDLSAQQLKELRARLKAQTKANRAGLSDRNALIIKMIQEKDAQGQWMHRTTDILAALQAKSLVPNELSKDERAEWLKKIQTVKQKQSKKGMACGYKASEHVFGAPTVNRDKVIDWLMDDENVKTLTDADRKAIAKQLKIK